MRPPYQLGYIHMLEKLGVFKVGDDLKLDPSVNDLFDSMSDAFQPEESKGTNAVVQFDIEGPTGGQWYADIKDGKFVLGKGKAAKPTTTIKAKDQDYLDIATGKASELGSFLRGKLKVEGDLNLARRLNKIFKREK